MITSWLLILGISLANNIDNTGVGIAYGAARIRLSPAINLWISVITFLITASSALFGDRVGQILPARMSKLLGAAILCMIGAFVMRSGFLTRKENPSGAGHPLQRILEDPEQADQDASRHIDFREGTLLGIALSINNVGGGVSAGLVHLSTVGTALCSALASFLVLWLGGWVGQRLGTVKTAMGAPIVAGGLLIAIGLFQFR